MNHARGCAGDQPLRQHDLTFTCPTCNEKAELASAADVQQFLMDEIARRDTKGHTPSVPVSKAPVDDKEQYSGEFADRKFKEECLTRLAGLQIPTGYSFSVARRRGWTVDTVVAEIKRNQRSSVVSTGVHMRFPATHAQDDTRSKRSTDPLEKAKRRLNRKTVAKVKAQPKKWAAACKRALGAINALMEMTEDDELIQKLWDAWDVVDDAREQAPVAQTEKKVYRDPHELVGDPIGLSKALDDLMGRTKRTFTATADGKVVDTAARSVVVTCQCGTKNRIKIDAPGEVKCGKCRVQIPAFKYRTK